jgi:hypothetical protein
MPHSLIMAGPAILAFSRSKPSAIIANRHQQVSQKWKGCSRAVSTSRVILISFSLTSRLDPALAFNYARFLAETAGDGRVGAVGEAPIESASPTAKPRPHP